MNSINIRNRSALPVIIFKKTIFWVILGTNLIIHSNESSRKDGKREIC